MTLHEYIKKNGGVPAWAEMLGIAKSTLYSKLNGARPIFRDEAVRLEKLSKGRFPREQIIFGKVVGKSK